MKILNTLILLLIIGLTITACKEETSTIEEEPAVDLTSLMGEWIIETAERGEKPVPSLNGGVFNFVDDKTVILGVNLPGINIDEPVTYDLDGESIKNVGSEKLNFDIETLDAKNMVLNVKIQGFDCRFNLTRKE